MEIPVLSGRFCRRATIGNVTRLLLLGFAICVFVLPGFSQGNAGIILGAITDQTGGTMAGVTITVTDVQRGTTRNLTTDQAGAYSAPNLTPSTYTVRAEFMGFRAAERTGIVLETGGNLRVDLTMQPGAQTQTVTVTEALPLVEATNAELGGTLNSDIVNQLPMNGRNFSNLLQLRPGFTIYPGGSGWTQSTNGLRNTDNVYMVDGINGNDPWMSQAVWDSVMASGDSGTLISIDSIDEFKTEENPRAEYGWKPGGIVNVGIKSGTNTMHGTAFAYGRDGAWDARNYFNPAPAPTPSISLEQFGATFGGPIVKDKLFYFMTFEEQRYALGATQVISDPVTGDATTGKAAGTNLIAACQAALAVGAVGSGTPGALTALSTQLSGLSNTCVPLSNYPGLWPVIAGTNPTGLTGPLGVNSINSGLPNNNRIDSGLGKVNYHLNDKNSLSALYYISPGVGVLNDSPSQTNSVYETSQYARSMAFAGNWTYTPNSAWVNEVRVGYSHYYQSFLSNDANQNPAAYNFNGSTYSIYTGQTNPFYGGFPGLSINGLSGSLGAGWPKIVGPDGVLQITDHISYLAGKHSLKFGGEILSLQSQSNVTSNTKGPIGFSSLQDFFAGMPNGVPPPGTLQGGNSSDSNGSASILTGSLLRNFSFGAYALFVQDDYRVTPRLTVNLGLRWELNGVPKERNNLQGNFNAAAPTGIQQVGYGLTSTYNGDHNNFGPRLGLAWDIFGTGRTILRASGGILYEQMGLDVLQGIGNANGLRAEPTGAGLVYCSISQTGTCPALDTVVQPGTGTIGNINTSFSNTPILNGTSCPAANGECPGGIPFNWANNGTATPLYSYQPYCGDGKTAIPSGPLAGYKPAQCAIYGVTPNLRTPYVAEYSLGIQHQITHNVGLDIGYVGNKGTKFLSNLDINQPNCASAAVAAAVPGSAALPCAAGVSGPGWTQAAVNTCLASAATNYNKCSKAVNTSNETLTRPFGTQFPYFKTINEFGNFDNSNYNSLQATLTMRNYHGLTLTGGYTWSHALGVASGQGTGGGGCTPNNAYASLDSQCYGPTEFDIRNRETFSATYAVPGRPGFGQILQGWSFNAVTIIQSGLPWGVSDSSTDFNGTGDVSNYWNFSGNPNDFKAINNYNSVPLPVSQAPGIPWYPGANQAAAGYQANGPAGPGGACYQASSYSQLALASLANLGCYALGSSVLTPPAYGSFATSNLRNVFRDNGFWNVDASVTKSFKVTERFSAQFRAEFFNVLNHPDFVNPAGGPGGGGASLNPSRAGSTGSGLGYVTNTPDIAGSNPVLGSGGPRAMQLGLKLIF